MKKSKLIVLLSALSEEELKQFYKFVRSPYFTNSEDVIRLFLQLRKYYPEFETKKVQKEFVFNKLFPEEQYIDIKMRNLMRKLTRIVEDYLLHLDTRKEDFKRRRRLTEIYGRRNVYSYFERETLKLR